MQVLYTAEVTAVGARSGHVTSSDNLLDLKLSLPPGMGGSGGATNPEQLFGAGYAACFGGAVEYLARQQKIATGTVTVKAKVSIGPYDPMTFISVALLLLLVALAATLIPARVAMNVEPVVALRYE